MGGQKKEIASSESVVIYCFVYFDLASRVTMSAAIRRVGIGMLFLKGHEPDQLTCGK